MEDIIKVTPMPWAKNRSWAKGIESGISGLGQYLNIETKYDPPHYRSTAGIQTKSKVRGGQFRPTKYISDILNRYRAKFLAISNLSVKNINS